jgi:hypothetical protein
VAHYSLLPLMCSLPIRVSAADLPPTRSCPFVGRYRSSADETGCRLEAIAGCNDKAQLEIWSSCQSRPGKKVNSFFNIFNIAASVEFGSCDRTSAARGFCKVVTLLRSLFVD